MTSPEFPVAWVAAVAGGLLLPSTIVLAIRLFKALA